MVQMVDPDLGDSVCDPACGTAGFLIGHHRLPAGQVQRNPPPKSPSTAKTGWRSESKPWQTPKQEMPNLQTYQKGIGDKIPDWNLAGAVYLRLRRISPDDAHFHDEPGAHGIRNARLKRANVLSEQGELTDDDLGRRYQVMLANSALCRTATERLHPRDLPTKSKKSELLFLGRYAVSGTGGALCCSLCQKGCCLALPKPTPTCAKKLVQDFNLLAVVSLPAGVFKPYTG